MERYKFSGHKESGRGCRRKNMVKCELCGNSKMSFIFTKQGRDYYRCSNCKLEKIYPAPLSCEIFEICNDAYHGSWSLKHEEEIRFIKEETFRGLLNLVPWEKNKMVLDCGCAKGYFLGVAERLGYFAYGIEIDPKAVEAAKINFPSANIYQGTLEESSLPQRFFYAVFMNGFLEHTREPLGVLKQAYELLEQGGYLLITIPDTGSLSHKLLGRLWPHYHVEHLFYFNRKNIVALLERSGFQLRTIRKVRICVTVDYLNGTLRKSSSKGMVFLLRALRLLPEGIRLKKIWSSFGQMIVVARKH